MNNTPARDLRSGLVTAALRAAGAVTGLVVAIILMLNLHITPVGYTPAGPSWASGSSFQSTGVVVPSRQSVRSRA
jgi:hypothetical protein